MLQASTFRRYPLERSRPSLLRPCFLLGFAGLCLVVVWMAAASADNDNRVAWFGNWTVLQNPGTAQDGVRCVAVHKRYGAIQLRDNALYVTLPEEPRGYRYQVDSHAVSKLNLVSQHEQQTSTIGIAGATFDQLRTGDHVKLEILTHSKVLEVDIDVFGIDDAIRFLADDPACRS